jgi:hypothetical protein
MNDRDLEARLRAWYRAEAGEAETAPLSLRQDVVEIPRTATRRGRQFGRGRGLTLLAAAALLLAGGAVAAGSGLVRLPSLVPPEPEPSLAAVATSSPPSESPAPTALTSPAPTDASTPVAGPGGVWIRTGTMGTPRSGFSAVRLLDGRVLVAGGHNGEPRVDLTSAELYDPASGTWSATGSMVHPHGFGFAATLLRDGRVLVSDVTDGDTDHPSYGAELYDPTSGTWTYTGSLDTGGVGHSATLLANGKVLVDGDPPRLFDPDSGTWTATGQMVPPTQFNYTAALLPDGRVLVVGGEFPSAKAQLYDPDTGAWTATEDMREHLQSHDGDRITATLLRDDTVLVTGRGKSELYDPATGNWTATREQPERGTTWWFDSGKATLLLDGTVLLTGPDGAELYDPTTGSWTTIGSPLNVISSATLLLDGTVLVTEFTSPDVDAAQSSAELYVPAGVSPPPAVLALPTPAPTPMPTPTPIPTPYPTPYPPAAGPTPAGARTWTVTVVNKSSGPGTLFLAEEGDNGIGQLCGSVTPNVVPAGVTEKVTFLLPPKTVKSCWIWVNPVPGLGGSMFQTSDAPMAGKLVVMDGEKGPQGAWGGG